MFGDDGDRDAGGVGDGGAAGAQAVRGDGVRVRHAGAHGQVADDDVDRVRAERGADAAVPVDAAQQPPVEVSGLVKNVEPVAPGGDRVGQRQAVIIENGDPPAEVIARARTYRFVRAGSGRPGFFPDPAALKRVGPPTAP